MTSLQAAKLARQPGGEFLSEKETSLCELLSISPMQVAHPIFPPRCLHLMALLTLEFAVPAVQRTHIA